MIFMASNSDESEQMKLDPPLPPGLLSLPDDVIFNCLARVSKWDYPNLALTSKSFRSRIASPELEMMRTVLSRIEHWLHVCIRTPLDPVPRWFALRSTTGNQLVPIPRSPFALPKDSSVVVVGSEIYIIGGIIHDRLTSRVLLYDSRSHKWRKLPYMWMTRVLPVVGVVEGKIYVIGGSTIWSIYLGEMLDPTKQTWKILPDPEFAINAEYWRSYMRHSAVMNGKVYGMVGLKCFCYDPKYEKWETIDNPNLNSCQSSCCVIENRLYSCNLKGILLWHDFEEMKWREVKGLKELPRFPPMVKIANYGGNLMVLSSRHMNDPVRSEIWCTEIALVRRDGEMWGRVEWSNVVLSFPNSSYFPDILHCVVVSL